MQCAISHAKGGGVQRSVQRVSAILPLYARRSNKSVSCHYVCTRSADKLLRSRRRRRGLEEVTLLLHDAVELVDVDLTIAITVGLVDHVLELLIVDVLTELLSNTGEVAE